LIVGGDASGEEQRDGATIEASPEFREEAVRLFWESESTIAETARRLGMGAETLRKWVRQVEIDEGTRPGLSSQEHAEIVRLKREVRRLEEEKLILEKAAAYFARETGRLP
jgi:transposase